MSKPQNRLGKGLSALIPTRPIVAAGTALPHPHLPHERAIRDIPLDAIVPNRHQPRATFDEASLKELADSIRSNGVLQPVVVRSAGDGKYELVAGERRWRAARLAGLASVPVIVRELTDQQSFEIALIENLQREDLGPLERAAAYQHYLEIFGGTIEDLAGRLSESRANISNYLRLLKLQPEICYLLGTGELGMGQARAIAGLSDPQHQLGLAKLAVRRNLSVRQVEELVRRHDQFIPPEPSSEERLPSGERKHLREVEENFSKALGLRVRLAPGRRKNSGRIVISYTSLEEFDRVAERLGAARKLE